MTSAILHTATAGSYAGTTLGRLRAVALLLTLLLALYACREEPKPEVPKVVDRAQPFHYNMNGIPVHLAVEDCKVYFVHEDERREQMLKPPFYPMPSVCQKEEISADSTYIHVYLGRMAIGAGGCCSTEGTWRSRNGRDWQRRENNRWMDGAYPPPRTQQ